MIDPARAAQIAELWIDDEAWGTATLVGPGVALTCWHVVRRIDRARATALFGEQRLETSLVCHSRVLDYALVHIAGSENRGWFELGDGDVAAWVLGIPRGAPLRMTAAIGSAAMYVADTAVGMSGSAVVDATWRVIAIHQARDRGIPITVITEDLRRAGLTSNDSGGVRKI